MQPVSERWGRHLQLVSEVRVVLQRAMPLACEVWPNSGKSEAINNKYTINNNINFHKYYTLQTMD